VRRVPAGVDMVLWRKATTAGATGYLGLLGTTASAELALSNGIAHCQAYLNIHSSTFASGDIRGFLQPVPAPGSGRDPRAGQAGRPAPPALRPALRLVSP
jgi:hypothetical protein